MSGYTSLYVKWYLIIFKIQSTNFIITNVNYKNIFFLFYIYPNHLKTNKTYNMHSKYKNRRKIKIKT